MPSKQKQQQATQVTQFLLFVDDNLKAAKWKKDYVRIGWLSWIASEVEFCSRYLRDGNTK